MAERQYPGGISPFPTRHRPSIFNRLPPEEFIDRRGEPVLWFPALPNPKQQYTPGTLLTPDVTSDNKGYILGFQRTFRILEETLAIQYHNLETFYPAFSPIQKVNSAIVFRNELQGGNICLDVVSVDQDSFSISPNQELRYWHEIRLDYEVLLFNTRQVTITKENLTPVIELKDHPQLIVDFSGERFINACVGVKQVCKIDGQTETVIDPVTHDFIRIYLPDTETDPAVYKLELDLYSPIVIAYSTLSAKKNRDTTIAVQAGDLEAVISPYYPINEGDLIVMTGAQGAAKEISHKQNDGRFYLKYGPIIGIDKIYAANAMGYTELELDSVIVDGFHSFRLMDRSIQTVSATYSYHPQYRVKERLEYSALEGRRQPVKWRLSPEHTNLVFG